MGYKQSKVDKEITEKIEAMLAQQKALLSSSSKTDTCIKNDKTWQPDILTKGGVSYYSLNDKKYKVSVCNDDNDIVLKYWFKNALGVKVSVATKTLKEAQAVVNDIYGVSKDGKGKYSVSASKI